MSTIIRLGWVLGIGLATLLFVEAGISAQQNIQSPCGDVTRTRDVLVLNVEHLRFEPEEAQAFINRHAGNFRLLSSKPEEMLARSPYARNPGEFSRRAQKLGAKNGCDLVVLLKTGPYFGRQRGRNARMKDMGYALVVMGERTH